MALHSNKEIRLFMTELLRDGWSLAGTKRHTKMRSPGGHLISISSSPSCAYALENVQKDVRRIQQQESK